MDDGILTSCLRKLRMIAFENEVQHDLTWTEVERDILPNFGSELAIDLKVQPSLFDCCHTDVGVGQT